MSTFLGVLTVVVFVSVLAMRLVPVYIEYFNVRSSLHTLVDEKGMAKASVHKIKDRLLRQFTINNVRNVTRDAIKVAKEGKHKTVIVDYEVRLPMVANIDIVIHFNERTPL